MPVPPLLDVYHALYGAYGPQGWWPARSGPEVAIGAVLTQNTAWTNVERAIDRLRQARALSLGAIHALPRAELAELIRPAGTYRIKAARLQALARWVVEEHRGNLRRALAGDLAQTRAALLAISGIGPETADAILLYAGGRPVFVVDAYTRRILGRHGWIDPRATYADVQGLLHRVLPESVQMFNEYHALLVELGKRHCRRCARCAGCPLERWPHDGKGVESR